MPKGNWLKRSFELRRQKTHLAKYLTFHFNGIQRVVHTTIYYYRISCFNLLRYAKDMNIYLIIGSVGLDIINTDISLWITFVNSPSTEKHTVGPWRETRPSPVLSRSAARPTVWHDQLIYRWQRKFYSIVTFCVKLAKLLSEIVHNWHFYKKSVHQYI